MQIGELILLALGLSMDAFAVSICKGLATGRVQARHCLLCGLWFGGFQALMPFIGYLLGATFEQYIAGFDHWVAFALLALIGIGMLHEAFDREGEKTNASFAFTTMLLMAIATSIDALAVGITFGILPNVDLPLALGLIGTITFVLSAVGVKIGAAFGTRYRFAAQIAGGSLLILLGVKILLEHLGLFG